MIRACPGTGLAMVECTGPQLLTAMVGWELIQADRMMLRAGRRSTCLARGTVDELIEAIAPTTNPAGIDVVIGPPIVPL